MLRTLIFSLWAAQTVVAQQYAGDVITNTKPQVAGAELAYFRIPDPSGVNNHLTLLNYYTLNSTGGRRIPSLIKRVVIDVPGKNRNPEAYIGWLQTSLSKVTNPDINKDSVAIMSINTPNELDRNHDYPWNGTSTSNALVWSGTDWSEGANNVFPTGSTNVSTFFVLDTIIQYFNNATLFPNVKEIVIAGHSMGGQLVMRYASVAPALQLRVPLIHWVGNPNSYSWFTTTRPLSTAQCAIFDNWKDGFSNYTPLMTYGTSIVAQGRDAVLANLRSKKVVWAHGLLDHGDASEDCSPFPQGLDRNERFSSFLATFRPFCNTTDTCHMVDYINTDHDDLGMLASTAAQARFFVDNFYGLGRRDFDYWYPRQQPGDDPWPNPSMVKTQLVVNSGTFAGNMTYQGCYANQSPGVFTQQLYSNSSNSVSFCTNACHQAKFAIAAMQNSTQCYCGNSINHNIAVPVIYSSCYQACPGNSSQTCGGPGRLALYSAGSPPTT